MSRKKRGSATSRLRERANLSFCIVVIFFAVFSIIVLTEIFFIDERPGPAPINAHRSPEYEELVLSDDYLQLYKGPDTEVVPGGSHLAGRVLPPAAAPHSSHRIEHMNPFPPPLQDIKATNLSARDARWQNVRGTRYVSMGLDIPTPPISTKNLNYVITRTLFMVLKKLKICVFCMNAFLSNSFLPQWPMAPPN
jgi:hypothetical protein